MKKSRANYFRMRTKLGQLEVAAFKKAVWMNHDPFFVKNDRYSTGIGCNQCDAWGCAEIEQKIEIAHGSIFDEPCGTVVIKRGEEYESNAAQY